LVEARPRCELLPASVVSLRLPARVVQQGTASTGNWFTRGRRVPVRWCPDRSGVAVARLNGGSLARAREAAGLSQSALASRIGAASGQRVWQWERGAEQPRPHFIPQLAKALGVDPLELLDGDPSRPTISALRLAAGLTRDDIQARAMITKMTYNRIDRGVGARPPDPSIVRSLAGVLRVSADQVAAAIERARLIER